MLLLPYQVWLTFLCEKRKCKIDVSVTFHIHCMDKIRKEVNGDWVLLSNIFYKFGPTWRLNYDNNDYPFHFQELEGTFNIHKKHYPNVNVMLAKICLRVLFIVVWKKKNQG